MTLTQIAAFGQILSSLAVLGTLIYLAIELKQNTASQHAQARQTIFYGSQAEVFKFMEYPQVQQSIFSDEPISTDDYTRLHGWLIALMRSREFSWLQYNYDRSSLK